MPAKVLDLSPVFRCYINGRKAPPEGKGLLGALSHFGLDTVGEKYKEAMRKRILQGRPFSPEEKVQNSRILHVRRRRAAGADRKTAGASGAMKLDTLLHWGEFAAVSAAMEHNGVPVDREIVDLLLRQEAWDFVRDAIVPRINAQYGVYVQRRRRGSGASTTTCSRTTAHAAGISWPRHEATGKLDLRDKTFDSMAKVLPGDGIAAPAAPHP